jgi:hypothetical protein
VRKLGRAESREGLKGRELQSGRKKSDSRIWDRTESGRGRWFGDGNVWGVVG